MPKLDPSPSSLAFAEAADALSKLVRVQKDLFVMKAENRAGIEFRRILFGLGALLALNLTLTLTFGWITVLLFRNGWSPAFLALISFVIFGGLTTLCIRRVLRREV
jgi:hypothetical protein